MIERGTVLGCPVDLLERDDVLARINSALSGDTLLHVVTLNPEQVMAARSSSRMRELIEAAQIVTADGVGITLALNAQGAQSIERVTGVYLAEELARQGAKLFLLGGRPGSAERASISLTKRYPKSNLLGAWSGGRSESYDDQQSLARIAESGATLLLVAFGSPAQLEWIERNRFELEVHGVRVAIGVGGALDYLAGIAKQPPTWAVRFGLEWLVRLVREPWRWRRQLVLPVFAFLAGFEALKIRIGRS